MRRRLALIPITLLGSLVVASAAVAGGWAQVTLSDAPVADPPAGVETSIGLTVMQHGKTAVSWPNLTVVATDSDSGTVVRVDALAEGPAGAYVAKIVFPTAGDWSLTFESNDLGMEGTAMMRVMPAAVAPAAVTPPSPTPAPDLTPFGMLAALGIALVAGGGLALRGRRAGRQDAPVSASN